MYLRCRYVAGSHSVADGQWHELDLVRAGPQRFLVRVDGRELGTPVYYPSDPQIHDEIVYIGGVPEHLMNHLPSAVRSRKGFIGCMATLIINGRAYNLQTIAASMAASALTAGCTDSERSFLSIRCMAVVF